MSNPWGNPQPFDPNQPFDQSGVPYPPSYPGYPPAGYPPAGYPMQRPPDHPYAVWSMVLGILGLVCCGLASPFAIWTGRKAMKDIDASGGWTGGRGQAQAGFIMGIIGTVLWLLGILFYIVVIGFGAAASRNTGGLT